ncbi:MAG: tetratricopeptide repeat protein, partial [Candidatus Solibacter usitatus]|nr:tetratricopeptide repeat protein [Candidatus Solibacter usitatus]
MSTPVAESGLCLDNQVELRALCNMLRRAKGFTLGFARVNHPGLRERLVAQVLSGLPDLSIHELTLDPASPVGVVAQIENFLGDRRPDAMFVYGLESVFDLRVRQTHALDILNLNRDYFARRFPWPVVFWTPEFGMREFSRQAPDFWSGRSGAYHFIGESEDARQTLQALDADYDWSLSVKEKKERHEILAHVRAELMRSPEADLRALARADYLLARAAVFENDAAKAAGYLDQARERFRQIGDRLGEADCVKSLGGVAQMQARYTESGLLYEAALGSYRQIGERLGEANCVKSLGDVAQVQASYPEAGRLYEEALAIYRQIGDRQGEAN